MDHNPLTESMPLYPIAGATWTLISIFTALATILANVEVYLRIAAALAAIASATMAIRYYHFATKEKLKNLKSDKT